MTKIIIFWRKNDQQILFSQGLNHQGTDGLKFNLNHKCPLCSAPNGLMGVAVKDNELIVRTWCCNRGTSEAVKLAELSCQVRKITTMLLRQSTSLQVLPCSEAERIDALLGTKKANCPKIKLILRVGQGKKHEGQFYYAQEQGVLVACEDQEAPIAGLTLALSEDYLGVNINTLEQLTGRNLGLGAQVMMNIHEHSQFTKGQTINVCMDDDHQCHENKKQDIFWLKKNNNYLLSTNGKDWSTKLALHLNGCYCFSCQHVSPTLELSIGKRATAKLDCCGCISDSEVVRGYNPIRQLKRNLKSTLMRNLRTHPLTFTWSAQKSYYEHFLGEEITQETQIVKLRCLTSKDSIGWAAEFYYSKLTKRFIALPYYEQLQKLVFEMKQAINIVPGDVVTTCLKCNPHEVNLLNNWLDQEQGTKMGTEIKFLVE